MATGLYIISNIDIPKEEILRNKDSYLEKLKNLKLAPCERPKIIGYDEISGKAIREKEEDWEYEFPMEWDFELDCEVPDKDAREVIFYSSPSVFSVRVYEKCLELFTIYKYRYLYDFENWNMDNLQEFRKEVFSIISIFGGTEIIYLADNCCGKVGTFLECQIWEGASYNTVKKNMIATGIPFTSDYKNLKRENLSYRNIIEFVWDDFKDLK